MGGESSGGRLRELGEGVCPGEGVRERDLNVVGANPTNSGLTGQTGRPYRADRSGQNWPRADRNKFGASSRGLKLMTGD